VRDPDAAVAKLLAARQKTHGDFAEMAAISRALKAVIADRAARLSPTQHEALDQIAVKLARIVCGDPNHADHWSDIAGYARLGAPQGDTED
jgi:hypothetical protein